MSNKESREKLVNRLRAGESGPEMDREVARAFRYKLLPPRDGNPLWMIKPETGEPFPLPPYTQSLDAGMLLIREEWGFELFYDVRSPLPDRKMKALVLVKEMLSEVRASFRPFVVWSPYITTSVCGAALRAAYKE